VINTTTLIPGPKLPFGIYDYILLSASLLAIVCNIILIVLKKEKPLSLPDIMMVSLLTCLFGALLCFALINLPIEKNEAGCEAIAAITQFFFLASLTWSNSMAISIVRSLYSLRLVSRSYRPFVLYSVYALGLPLVCTMITYILSASQLSISQDIYSDAGVCFLGDVTTQLVLYLVPIYILIVTNCIIGIVVMVKIFTTSTAALKQDKVRLKKNIITCFKVSICLGLGWILLFAATASDDDLVWLMMQIFVESQGVLIAGANLISWNCVTFIKTWSKSKITSLQSKATRSTSGVTIEMR